MKDMVESASRRATAPRRAMDENAMSEPFWLSCDDPRPMLEHVRGSTSPRKLRWFACACVRAFWPLLRDPRSRAAVEMAERFADGRADTAELAQAEVAAFEVAEAADLRATVSDPAWAAARAAARTVSFDAYGAASGAAFVSALCAAPWAFDSNGEVAHHGEPTAKTQARRGQCDLLREIVGNPYRAVSLSPTWRT